MARAIAKEELSRKNPMNNKTITLNVPHGLTQEEARTRIAAGITEAKAKYATSLAQVEDTWTGNRMDFRLGVLGQAVTGRVDVGPSAVNLEIDMPWILAALAGQLRPQIEGQARKLLEAPPSKG
jgi:hypothetical protein